MRAFFHWDYSGWFIALFVGLAGIMLGAGTSYGDFDAPFYFAYFFIFCGLGWAIAFWLTSDRLARLRQVLTESQPQPSTRAYRGWQVGVCAIILVPFGLSALCVQWFFERKVLERQSGYLVPADDSTDSVFNSPCASPASPKQTIVLMGANVTVVDDLDVIHMVRVHGEKLITLSRVGEGLFLTARVHDRDGRLIARISRNEFIINRNRILQSPRPDRSTLIVEDEYGEPALYVRYMNSRVLKILGNFRYGPTQVQITDTRITMTNHANRTVAFEGGNGRPPICIHVKTGGDGVVFNVE